MWGWWRESCCRELSPNPTVCSINRLDVGVVIPTVLGIGSALLYSKSAGSADGEPARLLQSLSLTNYFWLLWKPLGLQRDDTGFTWGCLSGSSIPVSQPMVVHKASEGDPLNNCRKHNYILHSHKWTFPHRQRQGRWREIKALSEQLKCSFFSLFGCKWKSMCTRWSWVVQKVKWFFNKIHRSTYSAPH